LEDLRVVGYLALVGGALVLLFRLGTVGNLITFAAVVPLVVALYVVLKPINKNVALPAAL
jgi:hypothetical protein